MSKYIVYLEPAEEGGYLVTCPDFPGCVTHGETVDEALGMIKGAIGGYIASLKKHGEHVPVGIDETVEKVEVVRA